MLHPGVEFTNFFDHIMKRIFSYYLSMALLNAKQAGDHRLRAAGCALAVLLL